MEGSKFQQLLKLCKLHDFIDNLELGAHSRPIEDWKENAKAKISIDMPPLEQHLISLARAIANRPKILVVDDTSKRLNTADMQNWLGALGNVLELSSTNIFIKDRVDTLHLMDVVILYKDGEIFDSGTHVELLSKNSHYKDLFYSAQYNGNQINKRIL